MIKSLTGFGYTEIGDAENQINITIRVVNSRYLDIKLRGIDLDPAVEMKIRNKVKATLYRGSVQIQINKNNSGRRNEIEIFDRKRYETIEEVLNTIKKDYDRQIDISEIVSINDLLISGESNAIDNDALFNTISQTLEQVIAMRNKEGKAINADTKKRIKLILTALDEIEKLSVDLVKGQHQKYIENIKALLIDVTIDENRIAQEVAMQVDRFDFTEEIVRSRSHCEQLTALLNIDEPVGKKLNFILQELNRETNTIGSKSSDINVSKIVISLKSEIEKIREQVQNIL